MAPCCRPWILCPKPPNVRPAHTCIFWMESTLSRRSESNSSRSMRLRSLVALRSALTSANMCSLLAARCWMSCKAKKNQRSEQATALVTQLLDNDIVSSWSCCQLVRSAAAAYMACMLLHCYTRPVRAVLMPTGPQQACTRPHHFALFLAGECQLVLG
jgi:hypothetical protein